MTDTNKPSEQAPKEKPIEWLDIPADAFDDLLQLAFSTPSRVLLERVAGDLPQQLDFEWLLDVSDRDAIEGLLLMTTGDGLSERLRIGLLTGKYASLQYWQSRTDYAQRIAEELIDMVDIPPDGLTIEWTLQERTDDGDWYRPGIREFAPHLRLAQNSPLAQLHELLLVQAHLYPVLVDA